MPTELRGEISRVSSLGEKAWVKAREASDFDAFLPHLERERRPGPSVRRVLRSVRAPLRPPPILDDYEPGMRTAQLEPVLAAVRDGLTPLLQRLAAAEPPDDSCLYGSFPLADQAELAERVTAGLPIPPDERRLDETVHPFAVAIAPRDLRITTRFDEGYVGTALWSVMHEGGHALYENGIVAEHARSPLGHGLSLGFHESQSRLWENWVGRSRSYLEHLLPMIRETFPEAFVAIEGEALYRAVNRVQPSLIRVEADEVTYNLHIMMRFELEQGMLGEARYR